MRTAARSVVGLVLRLLLITALVVAAGCGGDDDATTATETSAADTSTTDTDTGDTDPGAAAAATDDEAEEPAPTATAEPAPQPTEEPAPDPTATPEPTPEPEPTPDPVMVLDDSTDLQELLLDVEPGGIIEIPAGTWSFDRSLSLDVDGVTIRGAGMDDTILSFADQVVGAEGLLVTASDFVIEDLAIEDSVGDALKINEGENVVVRRVRTEWTGGWSTDNGAYGIYPVQITNVLIEESVAIGASDAGIYVGQSNNIIVRNNRAEYNVAGIEIENSVNADVYGNVATNNTGGVLVFNLPGLNQQGAHTRVFDNDIFMNNTENFGHEGTAVAEVPAGSGILVMANDQVEIFDNRISDNRSANIIVTSADTVGFGSDDDPSFDGFPEGVYIHDNELVGGGDQPDAILEILKLLVYGPDEGSLPHIVWDGNIDDAKLVDGDVTPENRLCITQPGSEVMNADGPNGFAAPFIDDGFECSLEPLAAVELPGLA